MKSSNSFIVTLTGLAVLAILGWRGADVTMAVVGVCGAYVSSRAAQKTGMVFASSKDETSKTDEIIEKLK